MHGRMEDIVTIPNTAVKMNERRKKRAKNGMSKITNRAKKRNNDGRRKNQPTRKLTKKSDRSSYTPLKMFAICFPTNSLTLDVCLYRNVCKEETIRLARRPRPSDGVS